MAKATLIPWVPSVPPALLDDVLADTAAEIRRELQGDPFARTRWVYRGIQPRPVRSPASDGWRTVTTDRGLAVENPARNRQGTPYVRYIHYAGTPASDRVFARTVRTRMRAWKEWAARRLIDATLTHWRRRG